MAVNYFPEIDTIEEKRLEIQSLLDAAKTKSERNQLGQFATPTELAEDVLNYSKRLLSEPIQPIRFLDPAFGTGAFYSALLRCFDLSQIEQARGYEIDSHFAHSAMNLWADTPLELKVADFTQSPPPALDEDKANLLICNPPYVRHHHLLTEQKMRLQNLVRSSVGIRLSGLAGLYCYFLLIAHEWLAEDGLAGWLIPSEFLSVNYGKQVRRYLLRKVTLLHIHRFSPEDVQFGDALVSSAIVWFMKKVPPTDHKIKFSYGGTLLNPRITRLISNANLDWAEKWIKFFDVPDAALVKSSQAALNEPKLSDFFYIKRGLATGANGFFILKAEQVEERNLPREFLTPILPSPRYLSVDEVEADKDGNPVLDHRLFLLACDLPERVVKARYPTLWEYLQEGVGKGIDKRYLCRHRSPWYAQERRPASPILCTYMGRISSEKLESPFRFILNHSRATAPNVYLMLYPRPGIAHELGSRPQLLRAIWKALTSISPDVLIEMGRVYGGGLYKVEPQELGNIPADNIAAILSGSGGEYPRQLSLFQANVTS